MWLITAGLLAIACLGLFRLDASGLSTEDTYTKEFDSIKGQKVLAEHGLADNSNTIQVVANTDAVPEVAGGPRRASRASARPRPAQDIGSGRSYFEATINADISSPEAFDIVEAARDGRARASTAPTRWSVAGRRSTSTPRWPPTATTR